MRNQRPWLTLKQGETTALGDKIEVTTSKERLLCVVIDKTEPNKGFDKDTSIAFSGTERSKLEQVTNHLLAYKVHTIRGAHDKAARNIIDALALLGIPEEKPERKVCTTCNKCNSPRCPYHFPGSTVLRTPTGCSDWEGFYPPGGEYLRTAIEKVRRELKEILRRERA